MPVIPSWLPEPLWDQFARYRPTGPSMTLLTRWAATGRGYPTGNTATS